MQSELLLQQTNPHSELSIQQPCNGFDLVHIYVSLLVLALHFETAIQSWIQKRQVGSPPSTIFVMVQGSWVTEYHNICVRNFRVCVCS